MIDALYKERLDRLWDRLGGVLGRAGLSPDAVTWAGLGLNLLNAGAFLVHRNAPAFGILLAVTELLDNVDGAVARATGRSSRAGAYLDATTDRYRDIVPLLAVAQVTGHWALCFLAVTGSLLVSYGAALEAGAPPAGGERRSLPDLFERFERVALLCAGLILAPLLPARLLADRDLLFWALALLALGSHVTALQRFARGRRRLRAAPGSPPEG